MSEKVEKQQKPYTIEIDVVGYTHDFNRAANVVGINRNAFNVTLRTINANQISTLDRRDPDCNANDYRAARTRITMLNGEVIYTPRSVEELQKLMARAVDSPERFARCYLRREEVFVSNSKIGKRFMILEEFDGIGTDLKGDRHVHWIKPEEMQREFVGGDRQL